MFSLVILVPYWFALLICALRCDLVKKLVLGSKQIDDTGAETLAEILPDMIHLTETWPDSPVCVFGAVG